MWPCRNERKQRSASQTWGSLTSGMDGGVPTKRIVSINDLKSYEAAAHAAPPQPASPVSRLGMMASFKTWEELEANFDFIRERFRTRAPDADTEPINVLNLALRYSSVQEDKVLLKAIEKFIARHRDHLYCLQVRRITFIITTSGANPKYFTFRESSGFTEDSIYRHVDPALAFKLEMHRLRGNYNMMHIPSRNLHLHMYFAHAHVSCFGEREVGPSVGSRSFPRCVTHSCCPGGQIRPSLLHTCHHSPRRSSG